MAKLFLALALGLVGAVIVHIAVIFTIPQVAENNAWGRLSRAGDLFDVVRVDPLRAAGNAPASADAGARLQNFAFMDPAFLTASCRFSVQDGPVRVWASRSTSFWSASVYNRQGDNLYSINDRAAVEGAFDLLIGTHDEILDAKSELMQNEAETSIPVEIAAEEGYLTVRAFVGEESMRPGVEAFLRSIRCEEPAPAVSARTG